MTDAFYRFLPCVLSGTGAAERSQVDGAGVTVGSLSLDLRLQIKDGDSADMVLRLRGPGDVVGLAASQVVRTEPVANATGFEPNYFPFVEFARPDLPWLLSPVGADGNGRLRSWLSLVVVDQGSADIDFAARADGPAILSVGNHGAHLPSLDFDEAVHWAHVQLTVEEGEDAETVLREDPDRAVSRLVCPIDLQANTNYRACVVPAFDTGRLAGLGTGLGDGDDLASLSPAWDGSNATVQLPVYYSWTFATGADGDFESLVRKLVPRVMPDDVGTRDLDAGDPGLNLPPANDDALKYVGVLKAPSADPATWADRLPTATFRTALREKINESGTLTAHLPDDPVIAPPIYGRWHEGVDYLEAGADGWLYDLNEDPTNRVVAAFGTKVVQQQQEALMASAWEQVGEVRAANEALMRAQLAREVSRSAVRRHVAPLSDFARLQLMSPGLGRIVNGGTTTVRGSLAATSLPRGLASPTLRRACRPSGSAGRVARKSSAVATARPEAVLRKFEGSELGGRTVGEVLGAELPAHPEGLVAAQDVDDTGGSGVGDEVRSVLALSKAELKRHIMDAKSLTPVGPRRLAAKQAANEFGGAMTSTLDLLNSFRTDLRKTEAPAFGIGSIGLPTGGELEGLVATGLLSRMKQRIGNLPPRPTGVDELGPVLAAPVFPAPMYAYFRDLAEDWLVPGLEHVVDETITLLETNPSTIEAFLVGLNHEMARELLWREYPTDQRGTCFRRFWDSTDNSAGDGGRDDIGLITDWDGTLGKHMTTFDTAGSSAEDSEMLVLLIRGELLRRYPDAVIYAAKGLTPDDERQDPLFSGSLGNYIRFLGFGLTEAEARGLDSDPGWYFVLEQRPTAPRFGLDENENATAPTKWDEASWGWARTGMSGNHVSVQGIASSSSLSFDGLAWGEHAGMMAGITLQKPVRVFIHANDMLGKEKEDDA